MFRKNNSEKGVSLIITFFIMIIILSVVLAISVLLYSEIKVIRNVGNSVVSFYAADSGVEKVLYYDNQILPILNEGTEQETIAPRGLCSIFSSCTDTLAYGGDPSIYCKEVSDKITGSDCDPTTCANCKISFDSILEDFGDSNSSNDITYSVSAQVNPTYYLNIKSNGSYSSTGRQIETFTSTGAVEMPEEIIINSACVNPLAVPQGVQIKITANVTVTRPVNYSVKSVVAIITDSSWPPKYYNKYGSATSVQISLPFTQVSGTDTWELIWPEYYNGYINNIPGTYYVTIIANDSGSSYDVYSNVLPCN